MLAKDTSHRTVFPVFTSGGGFGMREMEGAADVLMVPDPDHLPRAAVGARPPAGCCATSISPTGGRCRSRPAISTNRVLEKLEKRGYDFVAGLEVECHIFKLEDARMSPEDAGQPGQPPSVSLLSHGYQYLTEQRYDQMEPVLEIVRRDILALGLPLRSIEVEFGPSQCEFTFRPMAGLEPADTMILFRSAVKQICHRHGYHATFMCRPRLPNVFASGWHLHQSFVSRASGDNAFMTEQEGEVLSPFGRHYLGGTAGARPRLGRIHDADHQWLQALPFLFAGARPRDLGARQPRRDGARVRRRRTIPRPGWKTGSASQPPIPISTWLRKFYQGSMASTARSIRVRPRIRPTKRRRRYCRRRLGEAVAALKEDRFFRDALGAGFSRLLRPHQERRDRALPGGSVGLGASRIFRDVLICLILGIGMPLRRTTSRSRWLRCTCSYSISG